MIYKYYIKNMKSILWSPNFNKNLPFIKLKLENKSNKLEKFMNLSKEEIEQETERLYSIIDEYRKYNKKYKILLSKRIINKNNKNFKKKNSLIFNEKKDKYKVIKKIKFKSAINIKKDNKTEEKLKLVKNMSSPKLNVLYSNKSNKRGFKNIKINKIITKITDSKDSFNNTIFTYRDKSDKYNKIINNNFNEEIYTNYSSNPTNKNFKKPNNLFIINTQKKFNNLMFKTNQYFNYINKNYNNINEELYPSKRMRDNQSVDNIFNYKQLLKKIKQEKYIEDPDIYYPINNKPIISLKQVKIRDCTKKFIKLIWMKRSTANLISYGETCQSMSDELFYKDRKRIMKKYPFYEKEADLIIKENKNIKKIEDIYSTSKWSESNYKKIGKLIKANKKLIKKINEKYNILKT